MENQKKVKEKRKLVGIKENMTSYVKVGTTSNGKNKWKKLYSEEEIHKGCNYNDFNNELSKAKRKKNVFANYYDSGKLKNVVYNLEPDIKRVSTFESVYK